MLIEFDVLDQEYRAYIDKLKTEWLQHNRMRSQDVYEVMRPQEQAEVHRRMDQWKRYVTPLAEAWWKEHGYGVVWPDDDSKPIQVHKLKAA